MGAIELKAQLLKMLPPAPPAQAPAQVAPAPKVEPKVVDWKLECPHHAKNGTGEIRAAVEHGVRIEVVPDEGESSEKVVLDYRDDTHPSPQPIKVNGQTVQASGRSGKYARYAIDAKFTGDGNERRFYHPDFWVKFRQATVYRVEDGPAVEVVVHNPRRYRVDVKFPELKGWKNGWKWTHAATEKDPETGKYNPVRKEKERTQEWTGWANSQLEKRTKEVRRVEASDPAHAKEESDFKRKGAQSAIQPPVSFKVDGVEVKLDAVEAVGQILQLAKSIQKIKDTFLENTPQVGWYFDCDVQVMQGTLTCEWYWKEHKDHRAYVFVDAYVALSVISITLEGGFGLRGLGFKAQLFIQISGGVDVKFGARRVSPEGEEVLRIPHKGSIAGAIGARVEAGSLAKVEVTGSTGLEIEGVLKIGLKRADTNGALSYDWQVKWTGIEVAVVATAGAFAFGGTWTFKKTYAEERVLHKGSWPSKEPFKAPWVGRDRIQQIVMTTLTEGEETRVADRLDARSLPRSFLKPAEVAAKLTERIDAHPAFDRAEKAVEGLAVAVRGDLATIAEKAGRKWIFGAELEAYVASADGGLGKRLDEMICGATACAKQLGP